MLQLRPASASPGDVFVIWGEQKLAAAENSLPDLLRSMRKWERSRRRSKRSDDDVKSDVTPAELSIVTDFEHPRHQSTEIDFIHPRINHPRPGIPSEEG